MIDDALYYSNSIWSVVIGGWEHHVTQMGIDQPISFLPVPL